MKIDLWTLLCQPEDGDIELFTFTSHAAALEGLGSWFSRRTCDEIPGDVGDWLTWCQTEVPGRFYITEHAVKVESPVYALYDHLDRHRPEDWDMLQNLQFKAKQVWQCLHLVQTPNYQQPCQAFNDNDDDHCGNCGMPRERPLP